MPLLEAGYGQCRWIISKTYAPAICCGADTVGATSWCAEHRARVMSYAPLSREARKRA